MIRRRPIPRNVQLIASFIAYLRTERGAAKNTLTNYSHDVTDFAKWLGRPVTLAMRSDIQSYISASLGTAISARTVARRLSCLRHFFRFLIDEEEIKTDPTRNLPAPKCWKTIPRSLSLTDLEKMVASLGAAWIDVRDKAMLLTFFASGLRESELANLKVEDLDLDAGAAKVWDGKGGKDGIVPLSPPSIAALRLYLETVRPKLAADKNVLHVFLTKQHGPFTREGIWHRVHKIGAAVLGKRISVHSLRHGFATALVEGGADIRDIQELMRHSSVDTTMVYLHPDLNYLRRIYAAHHPRAHIARTQG